MDKDGEYLDHGRPTRQKYNLALLAGALCNNAQYDPKFGFQGDPSETALLAGAFMAKINMSDYVRIDEIPFSSERKMMSVIVKNDRHHFIFSKGAPEVLINYCEKIHTPDGAIKLTTEDKSRILEVNS